MSDSCAFGFGAAAVNTLGFDSLSVGSGIPSAGTFRVSYMKMKMVIAGVYEGNRNVELFAGRRHITQGSSW